MIHPLDRVYNEFSSVRRQSTVEAHASAGYPFTIVSPAIDLDLRVIVKISCGRGGVIDVTGTSNAFPAYELIVNGNVVDSKYPVDRGPGIFNLIGTGSSTLRYRREF